MAVRPVPARGAWLALALVLALLALNASLTFENVWPTPAVRWGRAVSPELGVIVLIVSLAGVAGAASGARARRGRLETTARWMLPMLWVVLVAGRYVDVTAPGLYGRELNLYWDAQHLGNVAAMLGRAVPVWAIALGMTAAVLALAAAFMLARVAFAPVLAASRVRRARLALTVLSAAIVAIYVMQQALGLSPVAVPFASPVSAAFARQARYIAGTIGPGTLAPALAASPAFDAGLERVQGDDVLLVFVESYGAVTFEEPEISAGLADARAALVDAIAATRRHVVSAYAESPTFGGSSWLAHLTLLSGVEVHDQYAYTSLMASGRNTLLTAFERQGFRTVALMPGMRQPWPEGAFYGFDIIYGSSLLAYEGPQFGWWSIPDQYSLARLDALERARRPRAPVLAVYPTGTTHAPFGPVPPYQPEWSRILAADAFDPADVDRSMAAQPDLMNLRPDYVRAMSYEYRTFAGYLREHGDDDRLVVVLVGDHQPPAAVAGPDASWSVPVHVITRDSAIVQALRERGFGDGFAPNRPSLGPMAALVPMLLDAFSDPVGDAPLESRLPASAGERTGS